MVDGAGWHPLRAELHRWQQTGRVADLWLRDDDAVEPTAPLDRLLTLTGSHAVPATLAVIPAGAKLALSDRIASETGVTVAVHGWAHTNHAPAEEKKQELGRHRLTEQVLTELAEAKSVIDRLFGERALLMLVPPWNRIDNTLLPSLANLGFAALSVHGRAKPAPIHIINTHVDLIDWHAGRTCRDHAALVNELAGELSWRLETGSTEPIGILAHHLVHDQEAWRFLQELFEALAGNPACRWVSARDLM